MARGKDAHDAAKAALAALGKPLSRRARSQCELCGDGGPLSVVAIDGNPDDEPSEDWALLLCSRCAELVDGRRLPADSLRFLETAMWSELRPAQIAAVRALRRLDADWAREALDGLWLDDEVEALIGSA